MMKIAILNDIHAGDATQEVHRKCQWAPILLKRAVRRLNQLVRPDAVFLLGDLLDDGTQPGTEERLQTLKSILDKLQAPYFAIPGNHDIPEDTFFQIFDRPKEIEEHHGVRFLLFLDEERPHHYAHRSTNDIARFKQARHQFNGPIVSLQHTSFFPPERAHGWYNLENAADVIRAMKASGVCLSVGGHFHQGIPDICEGTTRFVNAAAFCEHPFPFLVIDIDADGQTHTNRHSLAMPKALKLVDTHMHTQMAYCSDNMDVKTTIELAQGFGMAGIAITEHSGHLYFSPKQYGKQCFQEGMQSAEPDHNRIVEYLDLKKTFARDNVQFGLEADFDFKGNIVIAKQDQKYFSHVVGAIHRLPNIPEKPNDHKKVHDDYLFLTEKILQQRVTSLAHPFRIFRRSHLPTPAELFRPVATLLHQYNVAAELNFHTNEPPVEFVKICLDMGIKFTLASDAHDLSEIGDFAYHLAVLKEAGFDGDYQDILLPFDWMQ
jgi:histidinol phosphatase-like PHP family hydrolase/predicted phosphodiesterase